MSTEYQIKIEIKESRSGEPLSIGKRFYATYWVSGTQDDLPYDVAIAAKNLVFGKDWAMST